MKIFVLIFLCLCGKFTWAESSAEPEPKLLQSTSDVDFKYKDLVPDGAKADPLDSLAYSILREHMKRPPSRIATDGEPIVTGYFVIDTHMNADGTPSELASEVSEVSSLPMDVQPPSVTSKSVYTDPTMPQSEHDLTAGFSSNQPQQHTHENTVSYSSVAVPSQLAENVEPPAINSTSEYGVSPSETNANVNVVSQNHPEGEGDTSVSQVPLTLFSSDLDPQNFESNSQYFTTSTSSPNPFRKTLTSTYGVDDVNPYGNKEETVPVQNSIRNTYNGPKSYYSKPPQSQLGGSLQFLSQSLQQQPQQHVQSGLKSLQGDSGSEGQRYFYSTPESESDSSTQLTLTNFIPTTTRPTYEIIRPNSQNFERSTTPTPQYRQQLQTYRKPAPVDWEKEMAYLEQLKKDGQQAQYSSNSGVVHDAGQSYYSFTNGQNKLPSKTQPIGSSGSITPGTLHFVKEFQPLNHQSVSHKMPDTEISFLKSSKPGQIVYKFQQNSIKEPSNSNSYAGVKNQLESPQHLFTSISSPGQTHGLTGFQRQPSLGASANIATFSSPSIQYIQRNQGQAQVSYPSSQEQMEKAVKILSQYSNNYISKVPPSNPNSQETIQFFNPTQNPPRNAHSPIFGKIVIPYKLNNGNRQFVSASQQKPYTILTPASSGSPTIRSQIKYQHQLQPQLYSPSASFGIIDPGRNRQREQPTRLFKNVGEMESVVKTLTHTDPAYLGSNVNPKYSTVVVPFPYSSGGRFGTNSRTMSSVPGVSRGLPLGPMNYEVFKSIVREVL